MQGEVIVKYDNNKNIIEKIFKINKKEVYENEFYKYINRLHRIIITHIFLPLIHKRFGNSYGYEYVIEKDDCYNNILYISAARFANTWGVWSDIGLSGYKKDYEYVAIKNNNLKDTVKFFEIPISHCEFLEYIADNSDFVFYEEDLKSEISEKYNIPSEDVDYELIEKYLKEKYNYDKKDNKEKKIINIFDEEDNIYSIII